MEFKKNDQAIYIKDLLFAVLRQWRKVLALVLVLAFVLGGYKGYSQIAAKNAQALSAGNAAAIEYMEKKGQMDAKIAQLEQNILSQRTRMQTAVFMQINAYEAYSDYAILYIKTPYQIMPGMTYQNPDNVPYIISAIRNILISEDVTNQVAQEVGYGNFAELISIYPDGNLMVIMATHSDKAAATALVDAYLKQLAQASASVEKTIGEHSCSLVSRTSEKKTAGDIIAKQEEEQQRLMTLETKLSSARAELAALPVPAVATTITNTDILKSVLIFAVLGAVGGFFVAALFICLQHITGSRVYSARMLEQMTGVGVLGAFSSRRKPCKGIDRLLKKMERRQLEATPAVTAAIMANLSNYCPAGSKLLIAGTCDGADMEFIAKLVAEAGYTVLAAGDLRKDAEAVHALGQCDCVVLAEACGVSRYPEVERSALLARDLGKPVAGCILIDG